MSAAEPDVSAAAASADTSETMAADGPSPMYTAFLRRVRLRRRMILVCQVLLLALFLLMWEVAPRLHWVNPMLTSYPSAIWPVFIELLGAVTSHGGANVLLRNHCQVAQRLEIRHDRLGDAVANPVVRFVPGNVGERDHCDRPGHGGVVSPGRPGSGGWGRLGLRPARRHRHSGGGRGGRERHED